MAEVSFFNFFNFIRLFSPFVSLVVLTYAHVCVYVRGNGKGRGERLRSESNMDKRATIALPDGYDGDTVECYREPLETDGSVVKLRVVGSSYLFRWAYRSDLEREGEREE